MSRNVHEADSSADQTAAVIAARAAGPDIHVLFNVEGHQVIAIAAVRDLGARSADALRQVEDILERGERSLEEAAIFPDVIRHDQPHTAPFHFVDFMFEDGVAGDPPLPLAPHVVSELGTFSRRVAAPGLSAGDRVDALSWLIHLCGDIHQPLHCATRRSALHPKGDRGGNAFRLRGSARNLHSLWDSSVDVSGGQSESELAQQILRAHPRQSFAQELAVTDFERWARAAHQIARDVVYTIHENSAHPPTPSKAYLRAMERHGRRQAALAAYRLSDLLTRIFA
jgi:hypothetical protein